MVIQVKAIFHRLGSGGKGRTENRWHASGAGRCAPRQVYQDSGVPRGGG